MTSMLMMKGELMKSATKDCITLTYYVPGHAQPATATIQKMCDDGTWYFPNLFVPEDMRNRGIASLLMDELTDILDEHKFTLITGVYPTGDLDYDRLIIFYKKYGFEELDYEIALIRYPQVLNS
ncbi:MAG: GNAT family N-acetyltransferase [Peptococcaceae bacterium]|nr:GNAT family N-acetyltransferase [Candidatus Syntrophopropionicum ammoniitolerans]